MQINSFCEFPFNRVRLTAEGNISFCCFQRPDPLKPEKEAYLGNVLENTFDEIWFSELCEEIRIQTLEGNLHKKCQCPGCPFIKAEKPYPVSNITYNEYPNFLEIDLPNTHCNVGGLQPSSKHPACIMCERAAPFFRPETNHLMEVLARIKHIVPNLYQIHIQGIAEPFFPIQGSYLLFDVLDALDFEQHKNKITLSVTTNGTLLKKEIRKRYLGYPHTITNFSIDAATRETYRTIRILDCFDQVLENMYAFDKERVRERQFLRVLYNINTVNVREVVEMVKIGHRARAEYVEFNPTDGFNHKILVNESNCGLFWKAQQDIIAECIKLKQPYHFIRDLDLGMTQKVLL